MLWTSESLSHLLARLRIRGGDSTLIEAKRAGDGVPQLAQTLCAFGNMPSGGTILLGVDEDKGFTVSGLSDVALIEAGIASQARHSVKPAVHIEFQSVPISGKTVLVATVNGLPLADKPCRTHGQAYLRQADGDYAMSEQEVAQLVAMQDRPRYDAFPATGSAPADLDPNLATRFSAEARKGSRRLKNETDEAILRLKGVTIQDTLTVAGLYGLGRYPQQYAPSLSITAAASAPGAKQRLSDLTHFDGPIPDLLEGAMEWVARNTRTAIVFDEDGNGHDEPEIPAMAVREFVANALIHRDLSPRTQSKQVEIRLLPDRLVISNPGGLWGVSRDQLGEPGGKSAVNEFLYEIGRLTRTVDRHRVIEAEGGGIREAKAALARAGLPEPLFVDSGVSFTVIIFRSSDSPVASIVQTQPATRATRSKDNLATVLMALGDGTNTIPSIMKVTSLTRRQVTYALNKLITNGQVERDGGQGYRETHYRTLSIE